ncbi:hypothetical protein LJC61_02780 [Ruminococcaceae bacterium OttesenSCG-928-A16]|nr:hypothetical protein [Ruminococcaceae bacterium OttesenSCG-928-A16]
MQSAERIIKYELNGETYWLNYSARASQRLINTSKDLGYESIGEFLSDNDGERAVENTCHAAAIMIEQGALYKQEIEKIEAPVISAKTLDVLLTLEQFDELSLAVVQAMVAGARREVEATAPPKKETAAGTK